MFGCGHYTLNKTDNISTTVHAISKSFVPFCSAQDSESTDINCLVFWAHCKNGKMASLYNKGFLGIIFSKIWDIDIIRMYTWFQVKWCN